MFNKAKGIEIINGDTRLTSSSDFKKFENIVAVLQDPSSASNQSQTEETKEDTAAANFAAAEDDDFDEAPTADVSLLRSDEFQTV